MIPKLIHYCWFGGNPLPEPAQKCIKSWQKYCPDYEIKEWNEKNFDFSRCIYAKEAYEAKKWAFVTDYVRLKVLTGYGGIYMDTDVEVVKPLDVFLKEKAFSGFEYQDNVSTSLMACEKNFKLFGTFLKCYDERHFLNADGTYDDTTNVKEFTDLLLKYGLVQNGKKQTIEGLTLYPKDYFSPKSWKTREVEYTNNTYAIHHFAGTWLTPWQRYKIEAREKKILVIKRLSDLLK
jgi:mannosyltransferase OCH1-like enzyme